MRLEAEQILWLGSRRMTSHKSRLEKNLVVLESVVAT